MLPLSLLLIAPKCVLCLVAYAGLGATLGLAAPELCGAETALPFPGVSVIASLGAIGGVALAGFRVCARGGRRSALSE